MNKTSGAGLGRLGRREWKKAIEGINPDGSLNGVIRGCCLQACRRRCGGRGNLRWPIHCQQEAKIAGEFGGGGASSHLTHANQSASHKCRRRTTGVLLQQIIKWRREDLRCVRPCLACERGERLFDKAGLLCLIKSHPELILLERRALVLRGGIRYGDIPAGNDTTALETSS